MPKVTNKKRPKTNYFSSKHFQERKKNFKAKKTYAVLGRDGRVEDRDIPTGQKRLRIVKKDKDEAGPSSRPDSKYELTYSPDNRSVARIAKAPKRTPIQDRDEIAYRTAVRVAKKRSDIPDQYKRVQSIQENKYVKVADPELAKIISEEELSQEDNFNREAQLPEVIEDILNGIEIDTTETPATAAAGALAIIEVEDIQQAMEIAQQMEESAPTPDGGVTNMETNMQAMQDHLAQQATAGGGGGGGGGSHAKGGGTNVAGDFHKHRQTSLELRYMGDDHYYSQRTFKFRAKAAEVASLVWRSNDGKADGLQKLIGNTPGNSYVQVAPIPAAVGFNNLSLSMFISNVGLSNIVDDPQSWEVKACKVVMNHLRGHQITPQYNGETVIDNITTELPFGTLLGHIYYPDPSGKERMKIAMEETNYHEWVTHEPATLGETLDDDLADNSLTSSNLPIFAAMSAMAMRRKQQWSLLSEVPGTVTLDVGSQRPDPNIEDYAPFGVILNKEIKKREEVQTGMDSVVVLAHSCSRMIDKRAWKMKRYSDTDVGGMQNSMMEEINTEAQKCVTDCRTAGYYPMSEDRYHSATADNTNPKDENNISFIRKNNREGSYMTPVFFMPYAHRLFGGDIQNIVFNYDVTYQIVLKRIPLTIIDDYYFHQVPLVYRSQDSIYKLEDIGVKIADDKVMHHSRPSTFSAGLPWRHELDKTTPGGNRLPIVKRAGIASDSGRAARDGKKKRKLEAAAAARKELDSFIVEQSDEESW